MFVVQQRRGFLVRWWDTVTAGARPRLFADRRAADAYGVYHFGRLDPRKPRWRVLPWDAEGGPSGSCILNAGGAERTGGANG